MEIWRVLTAGGFLVDLRPFNDRWPVDVVSGAEAVPAGFVDDTVGHHDDLAANAAIAHMVAAGFFAREQTGAFDLYTYWDTAAEFKAYMDERTKAVVPSETVARAAALQAQYGVESRVRTRLHMVIGRYRKLDS